MPLDDFEDKCRSLHIITKVNQFRNYIKGKSEFNPEFAEQIYRSFNLATEKTPPSASEIISYSLRDCGDISNSIYLKMAKNFQEVGKNGFPLHHAGDTVEKILEGAKTSISEREKLVNFLEQSIEIESAKQFSSEVQRPLLN